MNRSEADRVIGVMGAAWPREALSADSAALWRVVLGPVEHDDAMAAVGTLVIEHEFFPTPAKFREALGATTRPGRDETPDRWVADPTCPACTGTGMVSDDQGRGWTCRCVVRKREHRSSAHALAPGEVDDQAARFTRHLQVARQALAARGTRNHWHGGPDHCPVCGGVPADWQQKAVKRDRYHDPKQCLTCRAKESHDRHR